MVRERVGAAFGLLGMIMLVVAVRVWIGTPGPAFWCTIAAFTLLGLGIVLAYAPPATPTSEPATPAATTPRPDYLDQPSHDGETITSRPASPFAAGND